MPSAFTTLWTNDTCRLIKKLGPVGVPLNLLFGGPHLSEPSFLRAGVQPGDVIYPIRVLHGTMYVVARMRVKLIAPLVDYLAQNGELFHGIKRGEYLHQTLDNYFQQHPEKRYLAPTCTEEIVIGVEGSPIRFDVPVPADLLVRLRYRSQRREREIKHIQDGKLKNTLSVHGIYRLSDDSACVIETLFLDGVVPT
jgi:hypothetical protein